jgi:hypothetical protein
MYRNKELALFGIMEKRNCKSTKGFKLIFFTTIYFKRNIKNNITKERL